MSEVPAGWMFADSNAIEWNEMGPGVSMKQLGVANGRLIAMFKFDPGYAGGTHEHGDAEFTYVIDGSIVSNGVPMGAGHAYAAEAGTTHSEFRSDAGATVVSVFAIPGS